MDAHGSVYVSDLKPTVSILDLHGNVIARWDSPAGHGLWVDAHGDICLAEVGGGKSLSTSASPKGNTRLGGDAAFAHSKPVLPLPAGGGGAQRVEIKDRWERWWA
jgi:hypothetical protein